MQALVDPSSYAFSTYSVPVLVVGALIIALGVITVRIDRASVVSLFLLAMSVPTAIWLLAFAAVYSTTDPSVALAWGKITHLGVCFIPVGAFSFSAAVTGKLRSSRWLIAAGLVIACGLYTIDVSTDWIISGVHHYYFGYYPIFSARASWALFAYFAMFFAATMHLYRVAYPATRSVVQRQRLKVMMIGLAIAHLGTVDFLPDFHVAIYPLGYVFIGSFVIISAWATARYHLVDITPALAAQQVISSIAEGLVIADRDGIVRVMNGAAESVWGLERGVGDSIASLDRRWGQDALASLADPEIEHHSEVTYQAPDGLMRTVIVQSSRLTDHKGVWVGTVYVIHDITERWRSEEKFRSLVQNASDLIMVIDGDTRVLYQSPAIKTVLGYDAEATVGQRLLDTVHADDEPRFVAALSDLMTKPAGTVTGEGRARDSTGAWRHLEFTGSDQRDNPAIGGLVLNVRDVSERKQLEEQLRHQALRDPLTNLANRIRFADRLDHALLRGARSGDCVAVLFMDLDNFKGINDSLGHSAGDSLLVQVAERVRSCVRPADTAARLGGDEFALLLEAVHDLDDATSAAERIFDALQTPFILDGREIMVRASIGIAMGDRMAEFDAEALLREADTAMYVAKSQGRGCYRVFEPDMQASMMERLELLVDLSGAVERNEFVLHYQPIFLLHNGTLSGVEALVRWQHPKRGLMPPQSFIPLAEESGAILSVGSWVLNEACRQASIWQAQFGASRKWTMSVNVSVHQLKRGGFVQDVRDAISSAGVEPARLILEITESVVMPHEQSMLQRLRELKELGIGLAIDDFGTGYSSLSYLREFPFDFLKIDKSFIDDVGSQANGKELTKAIVEMGKTLDLELVAEGIERGEQLSGLQAIDCELGQGFYFAEPLVPAQVEQLLGGGMARPEAA